MSANGGVDKMLTPRQQMILHLIIQKLYEYWSAHGLEAIDGRWG